MPVLAALALSSCAGVGVEYGKRAEFERFDVRYAVAKPPTADGATLRKKDSGNNASRQAMAACLGQPDRKRTENGEEIWVWDQGRASRGILLMAGLPVPLLPPVGRDRIEIHFHEGSDQAVKGVQYATASDGVMFYPIAGGGGIGRAGFQRMKNGL